MYSHQLLNELLSDTWLATKPQSQAILPSIASMLKGEIPETLMDQDQFQGPMMGSQSPIGKYWKTNLLPSYHTKEGEIYNEWDERPEHQDYILYIPVNGMITKNPYYNIGTSLMCDYIRAAQAAGNVKHIILVIESGGGMALGTYELVKCLKECKIATTAYVNGMCCSAAAWIASACDITILSSELCQCGSFGSMTSIMDLKGYFEALGIKMEDVYSRKSTRKNEAFREFEKDGTTELLEDQLDVFNEIFAASVKENRPQIAEECYAGADYVGPQVISLGIADAISSLDAYLQVIFSTL